MSFFPRTRSLPDPPFGVGEVCLSTCSLDDDTDVTLDVAWDVLSSAETARAARFRFERDRARFVRGRAFLRRTLGAATDQDPARLALTQIGNGKPFLDKKVHFNLSHSADLAVLAISASGPVGIDLEFIDRKIDISGLVRFCFNEDEARSILTLPVPEQPARFFAFWTAKEARMKLTGDGMSLHPQQIALDIRDGMPVGYLRPDSPATQAVFIDLGRPETICCLALAQGSQPTISTCSTITASFIMEYADHVSRKRDN